MFKKNIRLASLYLFAAVCRRMRERAAGRRRFREPCERSIQDSRHE